MPMRVIARRLGASYNFAKLCSTSSSWRSSRGGRIGITWTVADEASDRRQLMAPSRGFAPAALRLVESGFDVIDINFGCPVKKCWGDVGAFFI